MSISTPRCITRGLDGAPRRHHSDNVSPGAVWWRGFPAAMVTVITLTACGAGSSAIPSGDVLACQHWAQQGQKLKSEATPSLADMALASGWVTEDAQLAVTPSLKTAFAQDAKAISDLLGSFGDTTAQRNAINKRGDDASAKIRAICTRDGIAQNRG